MCPLVELWNLTPSSTALPSGSVTVAGVSLGLNRVEPVLAEFTVTETVAEAVLLWVSWMV